MDLALTNDQETLREVFTDVFAGQGGPERARAAEPLGFDPDAWGRLLETGAPGMGVAESRGGGGATLADLAVVAEEYGAAIAPLPLVEHAVAARLLAGLDACPDGLLAGVVEGTEAATLALRPAVDGVAEAPGLEDPCEASSSTALAGILGVGKVGQHPGEQDRQLVHVPLPCRRVLLGRRLEAAEEGPSGFVDEDRLGPEAAVGDSGPVDLAEGPGQRRTESGTGQGVDGRAFGGAREIALSGVRHPGESHAVEEFDPSLAVNSFDGFHGRQSTWVDRPRLPGVIGTRPPMSMRSGSRSSRARSSRASRDP